MKIISISIILLVASIASASNFPLEITNIKPAGTGTPAILSTNRIFRAYPGLDYNIRPAVIGGTYPFTFSLSGQPSGMTINSTTGEIDWPNPTADSGTITLSVTDNEGTTATTQWAITVSPVGFYFVDANAVSNGTGTIDSPFNSITNMVAGTGPTKLNDIVYFRAGTYQLSQNGTGGAGQPEMEFFDSAPFTWLGYPGETVNIDGNQLRLYPYQFYYDRLNFSNSLNNGVIAQSGRAYQTIRRCTFTGLTTNISHVENQGFIYLTTSNPHGKYLVIQDNEFSDYTGSSAIGSLYDTEKALIENNYIHGDGGPGVSGICTGIGAKHGTWYLTVRGNKVIMDNGIPFGTNMDSQMADTDYVDVSFNYFKIIPTAYNLGVAHQFNAYGLSSASPIQPEDRLVDGLYYRSTFDFYYYRNTVVGHINMLYIDGTNCATAGPFNLYNNVIINDNTSSSGNFNVVDYIGYGWNTSPLTTSPWLCINDTNNLKVLPSANAIDSNGNLTNASYVGTYGWEVGTPTEEDHTAPTTTITPNGGRSNTAYTVTIACVDNVGCASTRYCLGSNNCTPASSYTTALTVKPGHWLCSKGSDAAGNAETTHCAYFGWLTGCK